MIAVIVTSDQPCQLAEATKILLLLVWNKHNLIGVKIVLLYLYGFATSPRHVCP